MNEHLPNEKRDQQFNDLPLPDEDASWQKMKKMLDRDDDDGRIIPPVFLRSCLGWGMLLLIGLTVIWLVVRPERWWNETTTSSPTSSHQVQKQKDKHETIVNPRIISDSLTEAEKTNNVSVVVQKGVDHTIQPPTENKNKGNSASKTISKNKKFRSIPKLIASKNKNLIEKSGERVTNKQTTTIPKKQITSQAEKSVHSDTSLTTVNQQQNPIHKDSVKQQFIIQPVDSAIKNKIKSDQKKLIVAAGLGLQQQIPIAGQTTVPYSYYGREGSLADYIPSIFVQLQKEKKWFVMGEFRYGAAQSVKELSYNQNTKLDSSSMNVTMTTMRLKKTYYHQLPFSFNYYLKPNLSVGLGGMYSRFYGAVTEKETDTWNAQTQTSTNFKEIINIKHFTDSFLYKTQVHFLVQADYQWKKFSFGLRYTKDIQPYIKYTRPDGTVDEEKNQSLQLMVRYRIWQSGKL